MSIYSSIGRSMARLFQIAAANQFSIQFSAAKQDHANEWLIFFTNSLIYLIFVVLFCLCFYDVAKPVLSQLCPFGWCLHGAHSTLIEHNLFIACSKV